MVACYKLQSAFFEALGIPGLVALAQLVADLKSLGVPVILDAKRGDVGATAAAYAQAYLGDGVFSVDALTVNPYLGMDALEPFIDAAVKNERGLFVLVKTSNPGGKDFLKRRVERGALPLRPRGLQARRARSRPRRGSTATAPWARVVGATYWQELEHLRDVLPRSVLLLPGYGAQGATADDVAAAFDEDGYGAVVNSSRGLTYLTAGDDYAAASRAATLQMRAAINEAIGLE